MEFFLLLKNSIVQICTNLGLDGDKQSQHSLEQHHYEFEFEKYLRYTLFRKVILNTLTHRVYSHTHTRTHALCESFCGIFFCKQSVNNIISSRIWENSDLESINILSDRNPKNFRVYLIKKHIITEFSTMSSIERLKSHICNDNCTETVGLPKSLKCFLCNKLFHSECFRIKQVIEGKNYWTQSEFQWTELIDGIEVEKEKVTKLSGDLTFIKFICGFCQANVQCRQIFKHKKRIKLWYEYHWFERRLQRTHLQPFVIRRFVELGRFQ